MRRPLRTAYLPLCRTVAAAALFLGLAVSAGAYPGQVHGNNLPRAERHEDRHEIFLLEQKWRQAILSGDAAPLESLLAADYVGILPDGTLDTKEQTVSAIRTGAWHITSMTISDRKVRFYGTTALVTSRVEVQGTMDQQNVDGNYRYTRVYNRDAKGNWKIVNFEANRINGGEESK